MRHLIRGPSVSAFSFPLKAVWPCNRVACSGSKSGCYSEYINYEEAGRNLGGYRCFYTLLLDRPGKFCSLPLEEVFILVLAFPWLWFLQTFGQISARKNLVREKKKKPLQKLVLMCIYQRICFSSKCFQHFFTAKLWLKSWPSQCCTTRIVLSKGNWAASSSLWRRELTVQCSSFSFLTGFHLKSLRLVNLPVTSHQIHLLEQVTTEIQGQGREDLRMGWFPPSFFMLDTSAEMSGESLCH